MAIYISHDIYDGSEAQLNWNLTILADSLGFNLMEMEGFGGAIEWGILAQDDPLLLLFQNFKVPGLIRPESAGALADRLQYLRDIEDRIDPEIIRFIDKVIMGLNKAFIYDDMVEIYEIL